MTFHPRGLAVGVLFVVALVLALDFQLGVTTSLIAAAAYVAIEWVGTGLSARNSRQF